MKKMRILYRTSALASAILLALGMVLATGIPEASASASSISGYVFCLGASECLNAWNGGPWVDVYTGGNPTAVQNDYFTDICEVGGSCIIEDTGGEAWDGHCIGDAYNNSSYADTSLDTCWSGWGTNFDEITCDGGLGVEFYNLHWKGYLGPPSGAVNGSHWYLNKPTPYCFLSPI